MRELLADPVKRAELIVKAMDVETSKQLAPMFGMIGYGLGQYLTSRMRERKRKRLAKLGIPHRIVSIKKGAKPHEIASVAYHVLTVYDLLSHFGADFAAKSVTQVYEFAY